MSTICDRCEKHICIEHPEKCNPNMTIEEKLEALREPCDEQKFKCPCESEAIHTSYEFGEVNVMLDIDVKGEGLIQIRAVEKEKPIPYASNKYKAPVPKQVGYAVVCDYCPICGRKLKGEQDGKNKS